MRVQHANINLLALACAVAMVHGGKNTNAAIKPREKICDRHAHFLRRSIGFTRERHDTTHGLNQRIIAGARCVRAGLSEARDRTIDQAGMGLGQLLIAQAVFGQGADLEILNQDIAMLKQLMDDRLTLGLRDIQCHGLLVAIDADEVSAFLRVWHERRCEAARIITRFRAFNLDHFRAQIAQHLGAGGAGQNACQIKHTKSGQRTDGGGHYTLPLSNSSGAFRRLSLRSAPLLPAPQPDPAPSAPCLVWHGPQHPDRRPAHQ